MLLFFQQLLQIPRLSLFGSTVTSSITENVQTVDGSGIIDTEDVRKGIFSKVTDLIIKGTIEEIGVSAFVLHSSLKTVDIQAPIKIIRATAFPPSVSSVNLGKHLTHIYYRAFISTLMPEVHFPPTILEIDIQAFVVCPSITQIYFDDIDNCVLNTIAGDAFRDSPLTLLNLPASVETIGNGAFASVVADTITLGPSLSNFCGAFSSSFIKHMNVHSSNPTFSNSNSAIYTKDGITLYAVENSKLTTISVNPGTQRIGSYAFTNAHISSISLVDSIKCIEISAFLGCGSLTALTLPANLEELQTACFLGTGLTTLHLPLTLTTIGYSVFSSCPSLTSVTVDTSHPLFSSDQQGILYDKHKTVIVFIPLKCQPTITLPTTITQLTPNGFQYCEFRELHLNEGITYIPFVCIHSCPELVEITIPKSVTTFAEASLASNPKLERIIFKDYSEFVESFLSFSLNPVLHTVDFGIGSKIKILSTFLLCPKLKAVKIPATIEKIDRNCFEGCSSLESFEISTSNNVIIGENAFSGCSSLTTARIDIPMISDGVFSFCTGLVNLYLSKSVKKIGANAFANCNQLTKVIFENIEQSQLISIEALGFAECTELVDITLPSSIKSLTASSFSFSIKLLNININKDSNPLVGDYRSIKGVVYKGFGIEQTFIACPNGRKTLQVEDQTRILGENSFTGCGILKYVYFNTDIIAISAYCFSGCKSLIELNIPRDTQSIGTKAFENCESLKLIYFCADNDIPIGEEKLLSDSTLVLVKEAYKSDTFLNHEVFKSKSIDGSGCPILPTEIFSKRLNLKSKMKSILTVILYMAFTLPKNS